MRERFGIDVRVRSEVVRIDRKNKEVEVLNRETGETYKERYVFFILSPGAEPVRPGSIPGIDGENVFTLRSIPDTDAIAAFIKKNGAGRGGYCRRRIHRA